MTPSSLANLPLPPGSAPPILTPHSSLLTPPLRHYPTLPSTNDTARQWALDGAPDGAAIVADAQTAGRGSHGRPWQSPPGRGLYVSFVERPRAWPSAQAADLALLAARAVCNALALAGLPSPPAVKPPNDVLVAGRKICGILVESRLAFDRIDFFVAGFGVNIRHRPADFHPDWRPTATSCLQEGLDTTPAAFLPLLAASWHALLRADSRDFLPPPPSLA